MVRESKIIDHKSIITINGALLMEMKDKFDLVGTKIQDFSLPNSRGETIGMKDLEGKNIVLVLFRNIN
ncbi:MAG: redoxin domain-containing protein [Promethearchaeota archaeon]|nr:MAG: redoxin domain-containing protein [Candidatus Lokiarchaeota archaeon]